MKNDVSRGIAMIIDSFLVNLIASLFIHSDVELVGISFSIITISFINSVFFFYIINFLFFDLVNQGQTIGKALVGIKMTTIYAVVLIKRTLMLRAFINAISIYLIPITAIFYFIKGKFPQDLFYDIEIVRE